MKKLIFISLLICANLIYADDLTMTFNGTSTTLAGVEFTFSTGSFNTSSDGTQMQLFDNHPYANMLNGGEDYKDIFISEAILISSVNVSWAVNVQGFKLQFLNSNSVVKEISSLTTGDIAVNVTADKIRFLDSGISNSGGFELASVSFDGILPVELINFNVIQGSEQTILEWQTVTEINNYGFEIERNKSKNSKENSIQNENLEWEKIGFVKGHGNSNSPKLYSFEDKSLLSGKVNYRLKQIDIDGSFEYSTAIELDYGLPSNFDLMQNFPNPFNPSTKIIYSIPSSESSENSHVQLKVYNILGKEMATLINEEQNVGIHDVTFNASEFPSGIYIYTLTIGNFVESKRMTLLK